MQDNANWKKAKPYTVTTAQAHHQAYVKNPVTLPTIESKQRLDAEIFKDDCPRCLKKSNSVIPCSRGTECSWPACSPDCEGRPGRECTLCGSLGTQLFCEEAFP